MLGGAQAAPTSPLGKDGNVHAFHCAHSPTKEAVLPVEAAPELVVPSCHKLHGVYPD